MISVEKGILISGRRGEEAWKHLYQKNIQQIKHRIQDDAIHFYCHDNWSFFFTAGADYADDLFLAKARDAFLHCGCYYSSIQNLTAVNVFHVVMGETDLLEKAQISMSAHSHENGRFFIYNKGDSSALMEQMDHRLFMTNVINDAIVYDRIVPYFQPIRDNRTKKICKYEALMRLSDKECNIYSPGQFLEISKNYHLYLQLSQPIFTYNKRKMELKQIEYDYENANISYALQRLNTEKDITNQFYNVYMAQSQLAITREELVNAM